MNKNDEGVEDVIDIADIEEKKDENGNDITDWKAIALERTEQAKKNKGIAQRYKTKFEKTKEAPIAPPVEKKEPQGSNDLGEKAYLIANGIKGSDEISFVQKMKKETGKDIESLIESTYFQTELKDFREKKASAEATPTGSKRGSNSQIDTVEYWLAKDELPPVTEVELRRKVVNAKIKKESSKGPFYNS